MMSELERVETGLGEECGVFGAYDMDGGDVAPSVYYGLFIVTVEFLDTFQLPFGNHLTGIARSIGSFGKCLSCG